MSYCKCRISLYSNLIMLAAQTVLPIEAASGLRPVAALRSAYLNQTAQDVVPSYELEIRDVKATSGIAYKFGQLMNPIELTVTDRRGRPVPGARVVVTLPPPDAPGATFTRPDCKDDCEYKTDHRGVVKITDIKTNYLAGSWSPSIFAEHNGRTSAPHLPAIRNEPLETEKSPLGGLLKKALPVLLPLVGGVVIGLTLNQDPPRQSRTVSIRLESNSVGAPGLP